MISHLHIKDFAIIEDMEVDFHSGLNIITGETGAGKSIIIEAISLTLGSRADSSYVRTGKEKAWVELVVDDCPSDVIAVLRENDIPHDDNQIIIKRELSVSGKNICKINNQIVSVSFLSSLCIHIADIHGQYDHQSLLNPERHIELLDLYKSQEILPVKGLVSALFEEYKSIKAQIKTIVANSAENERKRDFMAFELQEILDASLIVGEDEKLEEEIAVLQNSEAIYENLSLSYEIMQDSSPSVLEHLSKVRNLLENISVYSKQTGEILETFSDAYYKLEDLVRDIRKIRENTAFSPESLDAALSRLDLIDKLKRKYGNSIEAVIAYGEKISNELSIIENADEELAKLNKLLEVCESKLSEACDKLSSLRKDSAVQLEEQIMLQLSELSFANAEFKISFTKNHMGYTENGTDIVEFLISTNKGEALKPLAKIASGGEMSRIMLAFKKIIGDYDNIPTMIFDEIDTGISGVAASIIGKKLKEISANHQILCITHLPQITACGNHNYKIVKHSDESNTYTTLIPLSATDKINEIARLLGGLNITESTLKSAEELINAMS